MEGVDVVDCLKEYVQPRDSSVLCKVRDAGLELEEASVVLVGRRPDPVVVLAEPAQAPGLVQFIVGEYNHLNGWSVEYCV